MEVIYLNSENHKEPCEFQFHTHMCYELILYIKGNGYVDIENENNRTHYRDNQIVIIAPNTLHNEINLQPAKNIWLGFTVDPSFKLETGVYNSNAKILSLLESMTNELSNRKTSYKEMLSYKLGELLILLKRTKDIQSCGDDMSYVINYIEENIFLPLRIETLAKISNYSYDYFRHIFKENFGVSPKEYIIKIRTEKAHKLLFSTNKSITEIAYECGFYDSSSFCKIYKLHYGVSPLKHARRTMK